MKIWERWSLQLSTELETNQKTKVQKSKPQAAERWKPRTPSHHREQDEHGNTTKRDKTTTILLTDRGRRGGKVNPNRTHLLKTKRFTLPPPSVTKETTNREVYNDRDKRRWLRTQTNCRTRKQWCGGRTQHTTTPKGNIWNLEFGFDGREMRIWIRQERESRIWIQRERERWLRLERGQSNQG
jgi:hypothetical protein